jgi:hypothetical protein
MQSTQSAAHTWRVDQAGDGQVMAPPGTHCPAWQVSFTVQALPSLQAVPSAAAGLLQTPVLGLQVPGTWHWSRAVHFLGVPEHLPAWQVSARVQALPSSQAVSSASKGYSQVPVLAMHVPGPRHSPGAAHVLLVPAMQTPALQVSPSVHALPSSHVVP